MIGGVIASNINAAISTVAGEPLQNQQGVGVDSVRSALVSTITAIIVLVLILFFGKYLWNNVLHVLIPGVKEAKSVWQILGISILIMLLHPGSCKC